MRRMTLKRIPGLPIFLNGRGLSGPGRRTQGTAGPTRPMSSAGRSQFLETPSPWVRQPRSMSSAEWEAPGARRQGFRGPIPLSMISSALLWASRETPSFWRGEDSAAAGINGDEANNGSDDSGAAFVFVRRGVAWTQQAYLKASNTGSRDLFGCSVGISGIPSSRGPMLKMEVPPASMAASPETGHQCGVLPMFFSARGHHGVSRRI